ncbi:hypothetical protein KQI85_11160 [Falcatimonas sp. MSJ-15]|uniref:hypothetical protein n=1 Tax=Falcatimonas sp. MSJ-15 TaxID=2841515 RepID=UPI001C0F837C|nr:hypothetical protein [Falcatimonas sp. MSJ-15]MBU5470920.1 hypothetical protein [Falcatimonas sp. MSJ-15]
MIMNDRCKAKIITNNVSKTKPEITTNNASKTKPEITTNNTQKTKPEITTNNVSKTKTKMTTNNVQKIKIKNPADVKKKNSFKKNMQKMLDAKLEASLTVEASLIVPVAIMIFAMVILACIKLYDNSVIEAYSIITRVEYAQYNDYGEDRLKEITENMKKSLDEATISIQLEQFELDTTFLKYNINIKDNFFTDKTRGILKEDSSEYVRLQHFYKEFTNKKDKE